jgi:Protein of unknown function (DUF2946)
VNALRRQLQPITWLALLAMLALALLPTLSHALAAKNGSTAWAEVCTPQGMRVVAVDPGVGDPAAPVSAVGHLEHCPYCAQLAGAAGLPPAAPGVWGLLSGADALPALCFQAPRKLSWWVAGQPRGPPLFS